MADSPDPGEPAPAQPYVGPRPFERSDADRARFFGRDREVQEIVSLVVSHPLVLVYAQSGAGKTSLFNTAVAAELERTEIEVLPLARVGGGVAPQVAPGDLANLYVFAALQSMEPSLDERELASLSLTDFAARTRGDGSRPRTLVFDQFEELFTSQLVYELYGDEWQRQQEGFFDQVARAIADDPLLRIVFLMRKEYLAELEPFAIRLPERLQTRFHLEPLDREAALAAVRGPLQTTQRTFDEGVAEQLVDRLLAMRVGPDRDVRGRFVEPVQLQLVCRSLWQDLPPGATTITESDVQAFGDVDTVLGQFYDRAVAAAASAARMRETKLRTELEDDFITSIGTRGTVYRTREWERRAAALDELERRHLIHAEWRAGTRWYELTHDRLIGPIRRSNERVRNRRLRRRLIAAAALVPVVALLATGAALVAIQRNDNPLPPVKNVNGLRTTILPGNLDPAVAAGFVAAGPSVESLSSPPSIGGGHIDAAAFDHNGRAVLVERDGKLEEWDASSGRAAHSQELEPAGTALAASPDGSSAAVVSARGVTVKNAAGFVASRYRFPGEDVISVALGSSGRKRVALGLLSGHVLLTTAAMTREQTLVGNSVPVDAVAFSGDGKLVVAGTRATLVIWRVEDGQRLTTIPVDAGIVRLSFSPDSSAVAIVDQNRHGSIWRWAPFAGSDMTKLEGIKLFQRRQNLAVDGIIGPETEQAIRRLGLLATLDGEVTAAAFTPDGSRVVTASPEGVLGIAGPFAAGPTVRRRIVQCARGAEAGERFVRYGQVRPMEGVTKQIRLPSVPTAMDSGAFVTWCYWLAGAPDPNGLGYDGQGYTGTMLDHMQRISRADAKPGDVVVWTPPATGHHVALVVSGGPDPVLASHGNDNGPSPILFSDENAYQRAQGHGTPVWLTEKLS